MARYFALVADGCFFLYLYESPYLRMVTNLASIEIDKFKNFNILTKLYIGRYLCGFGYLLSPQGVSTFKALPDYRCFLELYLV